MAKNISFRLGLSKAASLNEAKEDYKKKAALGEQTDDDFRRRLEGALTSPARHTRLIINDGATDLTPEAAYKRITGRTMAVRVNRELITPEGPKPEKKSPFIKLLSLFRKYILNKRSARLVSSNTVVSTAAPKLGALHGSTSPTGGTQASKTKDEEMLSSPGFVPLMGAPSRRGTHGSGLEAAAAMICRNLEKGGVSYTDMNELLQKANNGTSIENITTRLEEAKASPALIQQLKAATTQEETRQKAIDNNKPGEAAQIEESHFDTKGFSAGTNESIAAAAPAKAKQSDDPQPP